MHRWTSAITLAAAAAVALAVAAPVAAQPTAAAEDAYLRPLLDRYAFVTSDELLTEAHKICATISTGKTASDAIPLVQADLGASVPAALDIILAAVAYRGC